MNAKVIPIILFAGFFATAGAQSVPDDADTASKTVFVLEIRQDIDARMNRRTELALKEAADLQADYVMIDMNTYGGAVYDANDIRSRILRFEKPVFVFINDNAASAGALISIACDSIYMAPGASIGAATVVTADGQAAPDKYQSYMRSIMRSTAQETGRNPLIAEAMVDEQIEIDSITKSGQIVTFSTEEAIKYGFCEGEVRSIEEALQQAGISDYKIVRHELSGTEKIISFFINPVISGILILIILGGLYFELQTPGIGFPLVAAFVALILYLTPYYLNGLAANWEIIMFFLGVGLLALEIFVIPGFGIAGISGITFMVGSLVLVMLNNDTFDFSFVNAGEIFKAVATALGGIMAGALFIFFSGARLINSNVFNRVALTSVQDSTAGYTSNFRETNMTGKKGVAFTDLRPCGKVMIEGDLYESCTRGEYIEKQTEVVVFDETGSTLKVKRADI